jgi:hypothetical protein
MNKVWNVAILVLSSNFVFIPRESVYSPSCITTASSRVGFHHFVRLWHLFIRMLLHGKILTVLLVLDMILNLCIWRFANREWDVLLDLDSWTRFDTTLHQQTAYTTSKNMGLMYQGRIRGVSRLGGSSKNDAAAQTNFVLERLVLRADLPIIKQSQSSAW